MPATAELAPHAPETAPVYEAAAEKYTICWRIAVDRYGANLHAMGGLLHTSLYQPAQFNGHAGPDFEVRFPEKYAALTAEIPLSGDVPAEDRFISTVTRAANREVDSAGCLYPGAIAEVEELMRRGRVVIWTAGDTVGTKEHPGSMAQYAKLALSGLGRARTEISRQTGRSRLETLAVISAENKLSEDSIERIIGMTEGRQVFVMDDRLSNLAGLRSMLPGVTPIWVQQDRHGHRIPAGMTGSMAELQKEFNAVDNFTDVTGKVDELSFPSEEQVYLIDYDGTLSNTTKRSALQQDAVIGSIIRNNWL